MRQNSAAAPRGSADESDPAPCGRRSAAAQGVDGMTQPQAQAPLTTRFHVWKLVALIGWEPAAMKPDPSVETLTQLTLTVFRLNGALLQWGDRLVEPLGLTSARWQMLGAIALARTPLTAPQVGEAMGVSRQGAQKQLNLLVEHGLVESRPNPAHRRSPLYRLTARGQHRYEQAQALWRTRTARFAAHISAARSAAAMSTLEVLLRQLQPTRISSENES
jgi:DNA-binding MarR family transcriptional regulator